MDRQHSLLIAELTRLLTGKGAHASFDDAVKDLPENLRGVVPDNMPYSIWQLVEHIRIAQWDMLQFSKEVKYETLNWPDDYWPKEHAPKNDATWKASIQQIEEDLKAFVAIINDKDLYTKLAHGNGQTLLREALQIADHNAYHTAEIIVIRRMLKAWK